MVVNAVHVVNDVVPSSRKSSEGEFYVTWVLFALVSATLKIKREKLTLWQR